MQAVNWKRWASFFADRKDRQLPRLEPVPEYRTIPASVARSLAIFQLGESGGGTIIEQAGQSVIPGIDEHYAEAMALFVAEEHRHAEILAICVRMLGGELIRRNWTANLFVFGRRLIGLRLKVLVLLAAEVVGLVYYNLLAIRLPAGKLRSMLAQLVNDERSHLHFHCDFLRSQTTSAWRRLLFLATWRTVSTAAAVAVLIDHRHALRDLGLDVGVVWRRWMHYSRQAERNVVEPHGGTGQRFVPPVRIPEPRRPVPLLENTREIQYKKLILE